MELEAALCELCAEIDRFRTINQDGLSTREFFERQQILRRRLEMAWLNLEPQLPRLGHDEFVSYGEIRRQSYSEVAYEFGRTTLFETERIADAITAGRFNNDPTLWKVALRDATWKLREFDGDALVRLVSTEIRSKLGQEPDYSTWLRHSEAAKALEMDPPQFSKLVDNPAKGIRDNGKKGKDRRIDPSSLVAYAKRNQITLTFE